MKRVSIFLLALVLFASREAFAAHVTGFRTGTQFEVATSSSTQRTNEDVVVSVVVKRGSPGQDVAANRLNEWSIVVLDVDPATPEGGVSYGASMERVAPGTVTPNSVSAIAFQRIPAGTLQPGVYKVEVYGYQVTVPGGTPLNGVRVDSILVIEP